MHSSASTQAKSIMCMEQELSSVLSSSVKNGTGNTGRQLERLGAAKRPVCTICMEKEIDRIFLPCGHAAACSECVKDITELCPICRDPFQNVGKFFLHSADDDGDV